MAEDSFWFHEGLTPDDIYMHRVARVLAHEQTDHQSMWILECGAYGKALVLDGKWQSSTADEFLYHEPLVHPAMMMHGTPRTVLILGGGEGATAREVLRWRSAERVVMIDIDGQVVDACKRHLPEMHQGAFDDARLELIVGDALDFLDDTKERWDVVISDLSEPVEHGPSYKLFTREYFDKIKQVLSPSGILSMQAGSVSPVEIEVHARLVNTVGSVFAHTLSHVASVPSFATPWGLLLARDTPFPPTVDPAEIDTRMAECTSGGFRLFDGQELLRTLQTPRYVRDAIATERRVYTLADPPRIR